MLSFGFKVQNSLLPEKLILALIAQSKWLKISYSKLILLLSSDPSTLQEKSWLIFDIKTEVFEIMLELTLKFKKVSLFNDTTKGAKSCSWLTIASTFQSSTSGSQSPRLLL